MWDLRRSAYQKLGNEIHVGSAEIFLDRNIDWVRQDMVIIKIFGMDAETSRSTTRATRYEIRYIQNEISIVCFRKSKFSHMTYSL
ncbi:hypothetical protein Bca4012_084042 [Brassica carinata]